MVGVEGTDSYGDELTRTLLAAGLTVLELLLPTRQVRRMDGKSDPVDAIAAARQVLTGKGTSTPKHTHSRRSAALPAPVATSSAAPPE